MRDEKIFDFVLWVIAACILLGLMTGCNPYAGLVPAPMATGTGVSPSPAVVIEQFIKFDKLIPDSSNPPLPYWDLATRNAWGFGARRVVES